MQVAQDLFDRKLAAPVGIGGRQRMVLGQRQALRIAVHRSRRTEHQGPHTRRTHRLDQPQSAHDVVVVVLERFGDRLADRLQAGEMDHRRCLAVGQHRAQRRRVTDVALYQRRLSAGDALHPAQRFRIAVAEIVEHRHVMAGVQQFNAGMRADIAGTAGHENHAHAASPGRNRECAAHGAIARI